MATGTQGAGRPGPQRPGGGPRPSAPPSTDRKIARGLKIFSIVLVSLAALVACIVTTEVGGSTIVPGPDKTERDDTVAVLKRAAAAQGICYGWELRRGYGGRVISEGSNLGDGMAVDRDPVQCPRWAKVVASVTYTSESSESNDYASVQVRASSDDIGAVYTNDLDRLGLTEKVFIDEPGWAICRAAVSLPLLLAEEGEVPPAPVTTLAPTASPSPLPTAGSDLWRDRWGYLVGGVVLLLITILLFVIGWFERRDARRQSEPWRAAGRPEGALT